MLQMTGSNFRRLGRQLPLLALGGLTLAASAALAQGPAPPAVLTDAKGFKYYAPYVDPTLKPIDAAKEKGKIRTAETLARRVLSGEAPLAGNKTQFDFYYVRMLFPEFTQTTDAALKVLPLERQKFVTTQVAACDVRDVHKYLVDLTFAQMKDIVVGEFHPACRYNAMLIISGLNSVDAVTVGSDKKAPEPLLDALPFILEQYQKPENNDAIRMAALLGLVRHLEWDNYRGPVNAPTPAIVPQTRDAIVKELLALAAAIEPPQGREAAGHEWFRRRAIEGLTQANLNQVDPAVAALFEKLLKDESESLAIRCAAATAIGKVVYRDPTKLAPAPTAKELGFLALLACDKELTRVNSLNKDEEDRLTRTGGGYGGYGGYGGSSGEGGGMSPLGGRGRGGSGGSTDSGSSYPSGGRGRGRGGPSGSGAMSGITPGGSGRSGYPGSGGSGMEGYGGYATAAPEDPKQYRFDLVRRRLRAQLYAVEIGFGGPDANLKSGGIGSKPAEGAPNNVPLRGVAAIAQGTPDEAAVKDISDLVGKLVVAVEGAETDMAALEKELRKHMKPLEGKTRKLAAVVAPVETPADEPLAPVGPAAKSPPGKAPPGTPAPPAPAPAPAAGDDPTPPAPAPVVAPAPPAGKPAPPAATTPAPPAATTPAPPAAAPPASPPAAAPPSR
jgi:hypothetical protein